jgi:hypothetical protein
VRTRVAFAAAAIAALFASGAPGQGCPSRGPASMGIGFTLLNGNPTINDTVQPSFSLSSA